MTTEKKTLLITGAGRGMGVDIAKAALAAGHDVVATGRNPDAVARAVGDSDHVLVVRLDVTSADDARAAVQAATGRFGRIDVLVNNAASFSAGYFEELTPEQMERQITVSLLGPMNITRAVLPVMRKQRSGHVVTISSSAGFAGFEYGSAYAASKFGVDGWMESLAPRSSRSASTRRSSTPASSAPSCSPRSRPATPRRRSRTTPSATPPSVSSGRA
jgi:NAD(P)-dependent dehydrogenase (short-subunit alcohol dehydrogenase family)